MVFLSFPLVLSLSIRYAATPPGRWMLSKGSCPLFRVKHSLSGKSQGLSVLTVLEIERGGQRNEERDSVVRQFRSSAQLLAG